jgi:hypothetical protein
MKKHLIKLCLALVFLFFSTDSFATHFRYGTLTYEVVSESGSGSTKQTTVKFTINQGWRSTFFFFGSPSGTVSTGTLNFGDGGATSINLTVTAVNAAEDWFLGTFTTTHTYTGNVDVTAFMASGNRISTLQGGNADDLYRTEAVVTLSKSNNDNPVSSLPAIVNVPINQIGYTFNLSAIDPNGDAISYALSTTAQSGLNPNNPVIFSSINSTSGEISLNTNYSGASAGDLWALQFMMTDSKGATSPIDFIIRITGAINPPSFISPTPANGTTFKVSPGTPVNFTIAASDPDAGDVVTLLGSGVPIGATFNPGTPSNPISAPFSWTPTMSDLGTYSVNFSATDGVFGQALVTINIAVSLAPIFDVPPTPAVGTHLIVEPNNNLCFPVQVTDPDPNDQVQITNVSGKNHMGNPIPIYSGVTLNPPIPTTAGNTTQTNVCWTPTQSQWGHKHMIFTATDGFNDQATHEVSIAVNTPPSFQSTPVTSACEGQLYNYTINVADPDRVQGDYTNIYGITVPAWLNFNDNGDGTATLSGTPSAADVGLANVMLEAQDSFHHYNGVALQSFSINVASSNACSPPPPPPPPPTGCDKFEINALAHGTIVNSYFQGMTVTVTPKKWGTNNAVIYDTDGSWPEDPDLNVSAGRFIIINEDPSRSDGDNQGPDDNQFGGTMRFDFAQPVNLASVMALDVQKDNQFIDIYDASGVMVKSIEIPPMSNGSLQMVPIKTDGVGRMDIRLRSSGAFRLNIECNSVAPTPCADYDMSQLQHGTIVNSLFAQDGLTFNVIPGSGGTSNAVVYDTDGSWIEDPDLNVGVGNVVIINEDPNNSDGDNGGPDDNQNGGILEYIFNYPVDVYSVLAVDVDKYGSSIKAYDAQNNLIAYVPIPKGPDGGVQNVDVDAMGVSKLEIMIQNSGGFRPFIDCSNNGTKSTRFISPVNSASKNYELNAFPNPFQSDLSLSFELEYAGHTTARITALDGRVVANLFEGDAEANTAYELTFNGDQLPEGVYLLEVVTQGQEPILKKLILQR